MKLFQHFSNHTIHTLSFGTRVWEEALVLSVEFPALMHAILCVSARHLAHLYPEDPQYDMAAAGHLAQGLALFREDLSKKFTPSNIDAFMATGSLLHYEQWCTTDFTLGDGDYKPSCDRIFILSRGLQTIFMDSLPCISDKPSPFLEQIVYSPRRRLRQHARLQPHTIDFFQSFFSLSEPLTVEKLSVPPVFAHSSEYS